MPTQSSATLNVVGADAYAFLHFRPLETIVEGPEGEMGALHFLLHHFIFADRPKYSGHVEQLCDYL